MLVSVCVNPSLITARCFEGDPVSSVSVSVRKVQMGVADAVEISSYQLVGIPGEEGDG